MDQVVDAYDLGCCKIVYICGLPGFRKINVPFVSIFNMDITLDMEPSLLVLTKALALVNGKEQTFEKVAASLLAQGFGFSNLKNPENGKLCYSQHEGLLSLKHAIQGLLKRVFKYMGRFWIVPFPLTSFVTTSSFDGALLRAFFIRPYVVNKNVEWWLLYQSNVPNVFQHFVRMKDELNYCIGPQITDLTELASVRITTAESMLIRGICKSVEANTTKLANGKPPTRYESEWCQ
jgi:hypothetical protein